MTEHGSESHSFQHQGPVQILELKGAKQKTLGNGGNRQHRQKVTDAIGYFSASSDDVSSSDDGAVGYQRRASGSSIGSNPRDVESLTGVSDSRIAARLRIILCIFFISMGIVFPIVIHKMTRSNEKEAFEERFDVLSTKILNSVDERLALKLGAIDSLRIAITSHVQSANLSWPFVTLPDYDLRVQSVKDVGNFLSVSLHPFVTSEKKQEWEEFAEANLDWLNTALDRQGGNIHRTSKRILQTEDGITDEDGRDFSNIPIPVASESSTTTCRPPATSMGFPQEIFAPNPDGNGACVDESGGPYYPTWQVDPPVPSWINLNVAGIYNSIDAVQHLAQSGDAIISKMEFFEDRSALLVEILGAGYEGDANNMTSSSPWAFAFFPIFSGFRPDQNAVAGLFASEIMFEEFLVDVLPPSPHKKESILAVFDNDCVPDVISYKVTGDVAEYLGVGDKHRRSFDHMVQEYRFEWREYEDGLEQQKVNLSQDFCRYRLMVYPHQDMQNEYVTRQPMIYAVCFAVAIFVVMATASIYDGFVQRRIRRAVKSAQENRAIVSSLFPENVRARMVQDEEERKKYEERRNSNEAGSRRNSDDGARRLSNEPGFRRFSNEDRRRSNDGRRRFSDEGNRSTQNDKERRWASPDIGGITDFIPFGNAVVGLTNMALAPAKMRLKSFLKEDKDSTDRRKEQSDEALQDVDAPESAPIADLFPHCTVLFADISGFTAWSSQREPSQVFTLLQAVFHKFDVLARKRDIFKVETIGDCYVAVTGLPDPQPDHAVRMTKFARAALYKCTQTVKKLEISLGPGTADLRMRVGLHSGPVTAGVLRGEKSRFQLFGDTVNTASRMESTGQKNRIQISESTAQLLIQSGRENWIQGREDKIHAKGKGELQTYWVLTRRHSRMQTCRPKFIQPNVPEYQSDMGSVASGGSGNLSDWAIEDLDGSGSCEVVPVELSAHIERLINWQVDLLLRLVKQIVAGRIEKGNFVRLDNHSDDERATEFESDLAEMVKLIPVEAISETIELPDFDPDSARARARHSYVDIPEIVISELREFVKEIALRYRDNAFHNFSHASHVSMSCQKILSRIVAPEDVNYNRQSVNAIVSDLHEYTFGITSDPITQLAIMIATLAHDVDHTGIPNPQRNKEQPDLADKYKHRSIAEQNSVDITWEILMGPKCKHLRRAVFSSGEEVKRFRKLLVNLVMATDIFEPGQKEARNQRWVKVFHSDFKENVTDSEYRNLKASIVIEHIIQASDVAHTMQHWQVYAKWNERLFEEMYRAYESGRVENDPSLGWYKGEIWFFDNYVIPLAKKLDECGVFGVTSDECLNYALENRNEWEKKGQGIVEVMLEKIKTPKLPPARKAARRRSLGFMARRSATLVVPVDNILIKEKESRMVNDSGSESAVFVLNGVDEDLNVESANPAMSGKGRASTIGMVKPISNSASSADTFDDDDGDSVVVEA